MPHILIIPGEDLSVKNPYPSIFELNLAHALRHTADIGFIAIEFGGSIYRRNGRSIFYKYYHESLDGMPLVRVSANFRTPSFLRRYQQEKVCAGLAAFERYIKCHGVPDLVHAHSRFLISGMIANKIHKKHGVDYVLTEHSSFWHRNLVNLKDLKSYVQIVNQSCEWLVVSEHLGSSVENRILTSGFAPNKSYRVSPNVVDGDFLKTDLIPPSKDLFYFLSIGSMDENKNTSLLLLAFSRMYKERKNVGLMLVGDGAERLKLEKLVKELNLSDRVTFKGRLNRNEIIEVIEHCHVLVSTSIVETFGVVLIEALALGRPVISTPSGGPASIVTDSNGILCKGWDVSELCEAMEKIYSIYEDFNPESIRQDCLERFGPRTARSFLGGIYVQHMDSERKFYRK